MPGFLLVSHKLAHLELKPRQDAQANGEQGHNAQRYLR
jgi:hypothetical protein